MASKIKVVQVSHNKFIGVTTLGDIRNNCLDPREVDLAKESDLSKSKNIDLKRAYAQRSENQRRFDKSRTIRAIRYSQYITEVDSGKRLGDYPPVTLWTKDALDHKDGSLEIPGACVLTALDGETQLCARYMLLNGFEEKGYLQILSNSEMLDRPFEVRITIASNIEAAMQSLHDMNHFATPVSEKETAALNVEGELTQSINLGLAQSKSINKVKARGVTIGVKESTATTRVTLMHGAIGAAYGKECLSRSPSILIGRANGQFVDNTFDSEIVTAFVFEIMQQPSEILRHVDPAQMMALGIKFNETKRIPAILSKEVYSELDKTLKAARNGTRAVLPVRTNAVLERLI